MRWSCPHCGINLAVSDDKIGSGWSFSRCYKCGGFALVRKTEINLIKVDKAPTGEPVLLPEASDDPTAMISQVATQRLTKYTGEKGGTAKIPPRFNYPKVDGPLKTAAAEFAVTPPKVEKVTPAAIAAMAAAPTPPVMATTPTTPATTPIARAQQSVLPVAIGLAAALAIGSGVYLYIQGQAIWEKARVSAKAEAEHEADHDTADAAKPVSIAKPMAAPEALPVVATPPVLASAPAENTLAAADVADVKDVLHNNAMAPARQDAAPANPTNVMVRIRANNVKLHTGPGLNFPVVGIANNDIRYLVTDWNDRWFKIKAQVATNGAADTAWVRNDMVQLIAVPSEKAPEKADETLLNAP